MNLELAHIFLGGSVIVGLGIATQMIALYKNDGKILEVGAVHLLSALDVIWLIACGAVLYFMDLTVLQKSVPLAFIVYMVLSFFYAGASIEGMPTRPEDIQFGKPYLQFGLSFSFVFMAWTLVVLMHSLSPISFLATF